MLPDFERKLLRIMYNYAAKYRKMPSMIELQRLTGRSHAEDIRAALLVLEKERYILWENQSDIQRITILEGWERS
ncbi:hypothetical protein J2Z69_002226 [Paenibacillus shirakamiensis]|uniref:LexA repressor DNA-binding domain-containing protein n=1 Tax=Paenibacillus shirakamiensis TaxID=1265935 RepID=A0ABS4JHI2_9BACL|nr:hypothetical protein [Paenibacillus shirakamiensis]MBP2001183.1 hypothetical protein [Paenibacillus shirakamiensis]